MSDNIIKFPEKVVKVPTLWTTGEFGVVVTSVKQVKVHDKELYLWFVNTDNNRAWDLAIPYPSHEDAVESYHMFMDLMRRMRFKVVNTSKLEDKTDTED